jgi:hypothetical protein
MLAKKRSVSSRFFVGRLAVFSSRFEVREDDEDDEEEEV